MSEENATLAIVSKIYDAAVAPGGMNKLAGIVADALGTRSGFIGLLSRQRGSGSAVPEIVGLPSATENFDEWARTAYAAHYHHCNVWFEAGLKRGFPAIVLGQEITSPEVLMRSEWFEYCQKLDAFHVLGAQFHLNQDLSIQFGAHRPRRSRAFDKTDRQRMSVILPHLQRALQIHVRLGLDDQLHALSVELFERLGIGVLVVDRCKRLLFGNSVALQIVQGQSALRIVEGKLSARTKAVQFDRLMADATSTGAGTGLKAGGLLILSIDDIHSLRLLISPLPPDRLNFGSAVPAALILISSPTSLTSLPEETVRSAYGLTPAESRLLFAIFAGERLSEYAERTEISIETVRTHLKRLLSKTGYHRQIDLVRALARDSLLRLPTGP